MEFMEGCLFFYNLHVVIVARQSLVYAVEIDSNIYKMSSEN